MPAKAYEVEGDPAADDPAADDPAADGPAADDPAADDPAAPAADDPAAVSLSPWAAASSLNEERAAQGDSEWGAPVRAQAALDGTGNAGFLAAAAVAGWLAIAPPRRSRSPRSSAAPSDQRRAVAGPAEPRRAVQGPAMVCPRMSHGKHRSPTALRALAVQDEEGYEAEEEEEENEEEEEAGPPYPWLADALPDAGTVAEPRARLPDVYHTRPWALSRLYQTDSGRAGILPGPGQSLEGPLNANERALCHSGLCGKSGRVVVQCGRCDACLADADGPHV